MARQKKLTIRAAAARLVGGKPKAHKLREDGSLAVIAPDGRKFVFTPDQVGAVRAPDNADESKHAKKVG
jgi:hypothetical protein